MNLIRILGAVLLAISTLAVPSAGRAAAGDGAIMLVGGALSDDNADVYSEFVRLAGGSQARIGVLSASSAVPHSSANAVTKVLKRYGAGDAIWIPVMVKRDGSGEDPANAALASSMTAFFFTGGDQFRYVQSMIRPDGTDGAVLSVIRQRFHSGAPVAGTSAGMQILAGPDMITGGLSYFALRDGTQPGYFDTDEIVGYWPSGGFGFFNAGLVDTHFDARGRSGRSLRLAADTGHDRVFGVGEDTALLVTGQTMRVLGTNGVSLWDLRAAQVSQTPAWSITGARWSYLVAGDLFDAVTWQINSQDHLLVPHQRVAQPPSADAFGSYALLGSALDLADAGLSSQTTATTAESPAFVVTLTKDAAFIAYSRSFTNLAVAIAG